MDLSISRVYGSSSNGPLAVAITSNLVAYVASGGVVVNQISNQGTETVKLTNQRFFCANQNKVQSNSPAKFYSHPESPSKDSYGIPRPTTPVLQVSTCTEAISPPKQIQPQSLGSGNQSQKLKTISSIAISPNEKYLALGESGNQPRIHIFSLAPDSHNTPIISIAEHSFGVHALKFSPDSLHLLSLGLPHDGFLYVWKISGLQADCIAVNKCTSIINGADWVNNDDIITYGVRHVKFWKLEGSEKPREVLQGKNVILGDFINGNFAYLNLVRFEQGKVLLFLLTSLGELCWYDPADNSLKLKYKFEERRKVGCVHIDYEAEKMFFGDGDSTVKCISLAEVDNYEAPVVKFDGNIDSPSKIKFIPKITMLEPTKKGAFYVTSNEEMKFFNAETSECTDLIDSSLNSNTGLKMTSNNELVNFTKTGRIQRINMESFDLEHMADIELVRVTNNVIENHVTSLDITVHNDIVVGDAYGNLSIYSRGGDLTFTTQAHEFSINDITSFKIGEVDFIVSIGRDRMIQIFAKTDSKAYEDIPQNWTILETLDCHKGNLLKLSFDNTNRIYTSSADRSISIHEIKVTENKVNINKVKNIALKATPSTFKIHESELFISTIDKQITIYNIISLEIMKTFKLHDSDMDSLLIDNISITSQGYILCSCSDKTIRVFNYNTMKQLAVNWGHSEPIKSLVLFNTSVITLSNSGCLFKWSLTTETHINTIQRYNELTPKVTRKIKTTNTPSSPPTRKLSTVNSSRTPTTAATKFPTTNRLTPSKLTNTLQTNLSPSPTLRTASFGNPPSIQSTSTRQRLSPASKMTSNLSPSSKTNTKLSVLKPSNVSSPLSKPRSVLSIRKIPNELENIADESKFNIGEVLFALRKFKENIGEYSYDEVNQVKREVQGLFDVEGDLLKRFNDLMIQEIKNHVLDK